MNIFSSMDMYAISPSGETLVVQNTATGTDDKYHQDGHFTLLEKT